MGGGSPQWAERRLPVRANSGQKGAQSVENLDAR